MSSTSSHPASEEVTCILHMKVELRLYRHSRKMSNRHLYLCQVVFGQFRVAIFRVHLETSTNLFIHPNKPRATDAQEHDLGLVSVYSSETMASAATDVDS